MLKKNGHAIFKKNSLEIDLFFLLPTTKKGVHTITTRKEALAPTSNGLGRVGKGSVPSCSFLSTLC
jgi:hypothetical protein